MTPLLIANVLPGILFFLAWTGIPLWMVLKRPERMPDSAKARPYLRAKAERNQAAQPARETARPSRGHLDRQPSLTGRPW